MVVAHVMSLPRDDGQDCILEPRTVRNHFSKFLSYRRHFRFDPGFILLVDHECLWHPTGEGLFTRCGGREVEEELEEDEVLHEDLSPERRVGELSKKGR